MIRINLLPVKELKAEVSRRREIMIGSVSIAMALVLIISVYLLQLHRSSTLQHELTELQTDLKLFNAKAKNVAELQEKVKEYENKNKVLESINKKKSGPVRALESLSAATPSTLWLTQFRENAGEVTITGIATDNQTIAEFLRALSSYAVFKETELVESAQSEQAAAPGRKFSIKTKLLYQPLDPVPDNKDESKPSVTKGNPS